MNKPDEFKEQFLSSASEQMDMIESGIDMFAQLVAMGDPETSETEAREFFERKVKETRELIAKAREE